MSAVAQRIRFASLDGLLLEGRLTSPVNPHGGAILCHPHPQFGGSMSSVLIPAMQRALDAAGWACLRFNFRGVGDSQGSYGGGAGETLDAAAALDRVAAEAEGLPLAVAGWSFGSLVGLAAAIADARVQTFVAVAPPVSLDPEIGLLVPPVDQLRSFSGRVLAICGTLDGFAAPDDVRAWAHRISPSPRVEVLEGADHFFTDSRRELAAAVAAYISR